MEVTPLRAPDGLNTPLGVDHPPQVLDGITLQRFVLTPPPSTADSGRSDGASPPPPVDQLIVPDSPPIVQLGHGRRKGTIRDVGDLSQGLCGKSVSKDETDKVKRNRHSCETKWYHLLCVDMESAITHWTCEACASSASGSRPTRRVRRG
ncbi:hypothetical protein B0H14DRAFT_3460513 [Mycena olivaceomarginata]|nr:hypothetical protein B0H14DRAFT_3460513 [Mycena olivaceomarginata]